MTDIIDELGLDEVRRLAHEAKAANEWIIDDFGIKKIDIDAARAGSLQFQRATSENIVIALIDRLEAAIADSWKQGTRADEAEEKLATAREWLRTDQVAAELSVPARTALESMLGKE